jgi:raffinose/stachyose/melibiose transport system substrate-binding protein
MKKLPLLMAALALLYTGCGRADKQGADAAGVTVLSFWHIMNYSGPREILADAAQRFEQDHPGFRVDIQSFENDAYKTKLAVEMASGNPPDILFTWGGGPLADFAKADKLLDLTAVVSENGWGERFIDHALALCSSEGRVYALPLDLSVVLLWCNRELFARHGLSYPQDFDELLALAPAFRAQGIDACALGNMKQWPGAFYYAYLANRCGGSELFMAAAEERARFADPAFVRAGELLRQLIDAGTFPVGFNGLDDGPARARFLREKSAMLLMGSWVVARILDEQPEFLDKLEARPFPRVAGGVGADDAVLGGVNCGFAVSSSCRHPEAATALLGYLTDEQVLDAWCRIGRIPALKTTVAQEESLPAATRQALKMLAAASSLQPYYDQYLTPRLAVVHKNSTQNLFAGTMSAAEAAAAMAADDK